MDSAAEKIELWEKLDMIEVQSPFEPDERAYLGTIREELETRYDQFIETAKIHEAEDADHRFFELVNDLTQRLTDSDDEREAFTFMVNEHWVGDDMSTPKLLSKPVGMSL